MLFCTFIVPVYGTTHLVGDEVDVRGRHEPVVAHLPVDDLKVLAGEPLHCHQTRNRHDWVSSDIGYGLTARKLSTYFYILHLTLKRVTSSGSENRPLIQYCFDFVET